MSNVEAKIKDLLGERNTLINEMAELEHAYKLRQERIIEINGSVKTLQEMMIPVSEDEIPVGENEMKE